MAAERENGFVYTCNEYREEMILVTLHKQLQRDDLTEKEKQQIRLQIETLEKQMGF